MQPAALLVLALLLGLGVPALLLYAILHRRARVAPDLRTTIVVVVAAVTVAPILSVVLRPLVEASALGGALAPVVFAPVLEEIGKASGIAGWRAARASRADALHYGAVAGLSFAIVENALYVYAEFALGGPEAGIVTAIYRSVGPVALHLACSALVAEALWTLHRPGRIVGGLAVFVAALGFHALANAVGPFGIVWPLVVDAAAAAALLWRSSLSRKSPLAPA